MRVSNGFETFCLCLRGLTYREREIFKLVAYIFVTTYWGAWYCGTLEPYPRDPITPRAPRSPLSFLI